jgi:hypothetical protein
MKILYPVHEHPLITSRAKELLISNQEAFEAHNAMAEYLLSLNGTQLVSDEADVAAIAVAMQVNFQIQQGLDPYIAINLNTGGQSQKGTTFRGYKTPPVIHIQARRLADSLIRESQIITTSLRTRD